MRFIFSTKGWLILSLVLGMIIASAIFMTYYEHTQLENCSKKGKGIVIAANEKSSESTNLKYKYLVGGTEFLGEETISKKDFLKNYYLGKSIEVFYSCSNPATSKLEKSEN